MTLYEFTPPTGPDLAWDQSSPLYRHFNTLEVGHTIYKDSLGVWHTLDEGYEEEVLDGALVVYKGGREYQLTLDEYDELVTAGFIIDIPPPEGPPDGWYPGAFPGSITFPTSIIA